MSSPPPNTSTVEIGDAVLTTATWGDGDGPPDVVMLHDGLGSIRQWRDLPPMVAAATGRRVMAYDRAGHGSSTPVPTGSWPADWLHREAAVLTALLVAVGGEDAALVGHSDGGSIAAIHLAETGASNPTVLLAAHSWVEEKTSAAIRAMRDRRDAFVGGLARSHDAPGAVFDAWSLVWTSDEFARWDIRPLLGAVRAPVMVVQGEDDEYASVEHAVETATAIGDEAEFAIVPDVGHLLHHEAPDVVCEIVSRWIT